MSGVFGCWHVDARPLDATRFHRSLAGISPQDSCEIHAWIDGSIGLADKTSVSTIGATTASTIDRTICVFDGRLDNRAELRRTLHDHPRAIPAPIAISWPRRTERFGDAFVERLEGDFALAVFDRRMNRLLLARDRVGLRPLCYVQRGGALLFASEAKALLAHAGITAMPDEQTLADFLLTFPSQDTRSRTFFSGILSVPPAHLLIATPESVSVRRYFDFDTEDPLRLDIFEDYVAAFHDCSSPPCAIACDRCVPWRFQSAADSTPRTSPAWRGNWCATSRASRPFSASTTPDRRAHHLTSTRTFTRSSTPRV